jgi:proteasome lid subunit RPN8/RPN11
MLKISKAALDHLRAHGEQTYPHECCGVLLGQDNGGERIVTRAVTCGNTRTDSPENRYNIDPKDLIRIQLDAREDGLDILGFYHSHPDHPARWSTTDLAEAHWIGCSYVITSVNRGNAELTNSFLLTGDTEETKRLEEEPIQVIERPVRESDGNG